MTSFLDRVGQLYGNPNAEWATQEKLKRGTPIRVAVADKDRTGEPGFLDAIAMNKKNKKSQHLVRVVKRGRKWDFYVDPSEILVRW